MDRLIGIASDYEDWTVRPRLAEIVSCEVLADECIVLPAWLHYFSRGQLGNRSCLRTHLLNVVIEGKPLFVSVGRFLGIADKRS